MAQENEFAVTRSVGLPLGLIGAEDNKVSPQTTVVQETGHGISHRRLIIIVVGLCLAVFLVALDQVSVWQAEN